MLVWSLATIITLRQFTFYRIGLQRWMGNHNETLLSVHSYATGSVTRAPHRAMESNRSTVLCCVVLHLRTMPQMDPNKNIIHSLIIIIARLRALISFVVLRARVICTLACAVLVSYSAGWSSLSAYITIHILFVLYSYTNTQYNTRNHTHV